MSRRALIIMAKRPRAGRTKTRLTPPLSAAAAADLYSGFLRDVIALARRVPAVTPIIGYAPADDDTAAYFADLAPDLLLFPQQGTTLNERLNGVLTRAFEDGFDHVAAINSDSPTLPTNFLADGFSRLEGRAIDVVLGPCDDGGYYFIGLKRPCPPLILDVTMSTPYVLADTMAIAAREGLAVTRLPQWYDVDSTADLQRLALELSDNPALAPHTVTALQVTQIMAKIKTDPPLSDPTLH